jgi:hypothetical protein
MNQQQQFQNQMNHLNFLQQGVRHLKILPSPLPSFPMIRKNSTMGHQWSLV